MKPMPKRGWYLYHVSNGKLVVDVADHTEHHKQALSAAGMPPPHYVMATRTPQTKETLEPFAKAKGAVVDLTPRPTLSPFVEPEHWRRTRESQAAFAASKSQKVK